MRSTANFWSLEMDEYGELFSSKQVWRAKSAPNYWLDGYGESSPNRWARRRENG